MTFEKNAVRKRELMDRFTAPEMLDNIASISLREYVKARRVGRFLEPSRSTELVEMYKENTNHVITFANDCVADSPEDYELRSDVWSAYQDWAECKQSQGV